ncbi:hypothetical protein OUZ56_033456 [Daphnia magna]|uniref:Uncharacterized protein n=1 Tax=Daphnia magna TaxID=35525 RepID=A0ABQ9ZXV0_9CRUS|nr:hypothetical protein OUZ56_033456 [Daphnia magna]
MLHYLCYSSEQRPIPLLWGWAFCLNIVRVTDNSFYLNGGAKLDRDGVRLDTASFPHKET